MQIVCPGCGLQRPSLGLDGDPKANASGECRALMNEVSYYTLARGDATFMHQHLVDAYGAQHVRRSRSTIGAAFALAGLYLAIERGFTGRQVQKMHMLMAGASKQWPRFDPPDTGGPLTVADVLGVEPGPQRDEKLLEWCASVWKAWSEEQGRVREMVDKFL
ncbi:MAG: DUF5946 family protein [Candidatus Dormibacteraeota bacterium]|nr:DUF5946 family protein [Candidatus Dormibacteraeota bacterium]